MNKFKRFKLSIKLMQILAYPCRPIFGFDLVEYAKNGWILLLTGMFWFIVLPVLLIWLLYGFLLNMGLKAVVWLFMTKDKKRYSRVMKLYWRNQKRFKNRK